MNRPRLAAAMIVAASLLVGACGKAPPAVAPETALEHAAKHLVERYQCPMHPDVTSDRPGNCPVCGMALIPVASAEPATREARPEGGRKLLYYRNPMNPAITSPTPRKDEMGMDYVAVYDEGGIDEPGAVQLSAAMVNNLGVRTAAVRRGKLDASVQAVGVVSFDERGRIEVRVRAEGYVERLALRAEGEPVRRGQLLFAVFSPKLAAAQREFLHALSLGDPALIDASAGRLAALGLDASAVERLRATGKVAERVSYHAPEDGVVTALGIREGALAEPGFSAMTIAPIARLWVVAEIPEAEAPRISKGASAVLTFPALPGQRVRTRVLELLPQLNEATRTVQARLALDNPGGRLAAGMLADAIIDVADAGEVLLVPTEAVIRTGSAQRVIVALGDGRFAPREVRLGRESGEDIQILTGLQPGEQVVVSGQFMIDSESQVRSSLRRYETPAANGGDAAAGTHVAPEAAR